MSALDRFKSIKVLVGFPNDGEVKSGFNMSMLNMMGHFVAKRVGVFKEQTLQPFDSKGSILPRGRLNCVKAARERKCTHVCFIDTDQTFPRDTLHRLLLADKDIIGCNIATKTIPASPTARGFDKQPIFTDADSPQYEEVWRLGCGIMLVKIGVWDKLGLNTWEILWKEELQDYQGEDWRFCELAQAAGYKIWVDHKLSDEIGHVGDFKFTHSEVGEIRPEFVVKEIVNG